MYDQIIAEVDSHKHLGVILSNNLSWHKHLEYILPKAWQIINIMRKFKYQLDRLSLEIISTSFIIPILKYGDILFNNCTQYENDELDKVQSEAARIVTGGTKLVDINNL